METEKERNRIAEFYNLINEFNAIDEPDIDVNDIYVERKMNDGRQFDFS